MEYAGELILGIGTVIAVILVIVVGIIKSFVRPKK